MPASVESIPSLFGSEEKVGYRRSRPGVLTFSREGEVLYMDQQGADLLDRIGGSQGFFSNGGRRLPQIILDLLVQLDSPGTAGPGGEGENISRVLIDAQVLYFFRAVRLRHPDRHGLGRFLILIEEVSETPQSEPGGPSGGLTKRERKVVRLLSEGKTNRAIALEMKISEQTVKEHIKRIMKRLKVTTRSGIVAHIFKESRGCEIESAASSRFTHIASLH